MSIDIPKLLEELYHIDPSLREKESEIQKIITLMIDQKPDIQMDEGFRRELRKKLIASFPEKKSTWNIALMLPYFGTAMASVLITVFAWNTWVDMRPTPSSLSFAPSIEKGEKMAFGEYISWNTQNATPVAAPLAGGSMGASSDMAMVAPKTETRMMMPIDMPPYEQKVYTYSYTGTLPELPSTLTVYKKFSSPFSTKDMAGVIGGLHLEGFDLSALENTRIQNLSLAEDRPYGYSVYLDMNMGSVNFAQNWEKWPQPKCDQNGCETLTPLTKNDIPKDEEVINIAQSWLTKYGIDMSQYGTPIINHENSIIYARGALSPSTSESVEYIPEMIVVTYPLLIEGKEIYEEYGSPRGITLIFDIRTKKITSMSGLEKQKLISSNYESEKDQALIDKMIVSGGRYIVPPETNTGVTHEIISLETPTLKYVHIYGNVGSDGLTAEYYIPAYVFPVSDKKNETGRKEVIVPVVHGFAIESTVSPGVPTPMIEPALMMQ